MKLLILIILSLPLAITAEEGITFTKDVRPILSKNCVSCHAGNKGLPNLLNYSTAFALRFEIKKRVSEDRTMPHVGRITESERDLIEAWVDTGAKE